MKRTPIVIFLFISVILATGCNKDEPEQDKILKLVYEELASQGKILSLDFDEFTEAVEQAEKELSLVVTIDYDGEQNQTSSTIDIISNDGIFKPCFLLAYFPKEVASSVDEIECSLPPTQIINEDPMIMWHVVDLHKTKHSQTVKGNHEKPGFYYVILDNGETYYYPKPEYGTLEDNSGNIYKTIQIGDQTWMAENMRNDRYADGTPISIISSNDEWANLKSDAKAYCYYDNDDISFESLGLLYTWSAATGGFADNGKTVLQVQGVCPDGWHIPSDWEWQVLEMFLGLSSSEAQSEGYRGDDVGGRLKYSTTYWWSSPNTAAVDDVGFSALPAGVRTVHGDFLGKLETTVMWTSSTYSSGRAWHRSLYYDKGSIRKNDGYMWNGYSVRCLRDD